MTQSTSQSSAPTEDTDPDDAQTTHSTLKRLYGPSPGRSLGLRVLVLALIVGLVYLWRPLFHSVFYTIAFSFEGLVFGVVTGITFLSLWFAPPIRRIKPLSNRDATITYQVGEDYQAPSLNEHANGLGAKVVAFLIVPVVLFIVTSTVGLMYLHPIGWLILGLTGLVSIGAVVFFTFTTDAFPTPPVKILAVVLVALFLLSTWIFWAGQVQDREIAEAAMDRVDETDTLPQINADNPRIVPRMVDQQQATGTVGYQQHKLGQSDIARGPDGSLTWSYPIVPDGLRNTIFEPQRGVFLSDMTTIDNRTRTAYDVQPEQNFKPGQGLFFHQSANWNLLKNGYWTQYNDDPVEFIGPNGDAYMAYPQTGHEWNIEFAFGVIPMPYTQPVWDGVTLIDTDGDITQYSPSEARDEPVLAGQRLYPFDVMNKYISRLGYRDGIINQYPIVGAHENEIELADMPSGAGNSQPFLVDFEERGFGYVATFEPFGENTRGLSELWIADGRTGEFERVQIPEGTDVFGPERAVGLVTSEDTRTNWDRFDVVEPVPVFIDGTLYWQTKVVPNSNRAIARNVFVNAEDGTAIEIQTTDEITQFLAGEQRLDEFDQINNGTQEDNRSDSDTGSTGDETIIVIRDANGNVVDEIVLDNGTTIEISRNTSRGDN